MRFLARLFLNGLSIIVAAYFIPGLHVADPAAGLIAGAILGLVNAIVKPILIILTLPFTLLTLGLFLFVLNAICLGLTALVVPGFEISSFSAAMFGAIVVSVVSWILNGLLVPKRERRR